ncbi:MAG TPA: hypothetical protein VKX45_14135 [Bryobacteraceae bacterium]|nr:hypothetical protein [Bryobacteraceae bacterium]
MKNLTGIAFCATLLVISWPVRAQKRQGPNDIQLSEFRQAMVDLGAYLDAHKGTDLQRKFAVLPDSAFEKWYPIVPNPRAFQSAVAALREHDAAAAPRQQPPVQATMAPMAVTPACPANSIIDIASGAACTPAYPDPSNAAWQSMINGLIGINAFSSTHYGDVSSQQCGLTVEVNLEQAHVTLEALDNIGAAGCNSIPNLPVAEDGRAACFAVAAATATAAAASAGLYTTCLEQDNLVNSAEINANFLNTVTIYNNLKGADTLVNNFFSSTDSSVNNINTQVTNDFTSIGGQVTNIQTSVTNASNQVSTDYQTVDASVTNLNNQVTGDFNAFTTHLTNVNNHVASEFAALDAHLVALINQLASQIGQGTALVGADARQLMKLQLTPDGKKVLNPAILTCTGTNCPDVLAACAAAGCSWNNVGPLP